MLGNCSDNNTFYGNTGLHISSMASTEDIACLIHAGNGSIPPHTFETITTYLLAEEYITSIGNEASEYYEQCASLPESIDVSHNRRNEALNINIITPGDVVKDNYIQFSVNCTDRYNNIIDDLQGITVNYEVSTFFVNSSNDVVQGITKNFLRYDWLLFFEFVCCVCLCVYG